jgi:hypothetical protein
LYLINNKKKKLKIKMFYRVYSYGQLFLYFGPLCPVVGNAERGGVVSSLFIDVAQTVENVAIEMH